jgi:hypothetical protein
MDQTLDISRHADEYAVAAARAYVASQRARPGATARSPDGTVAVTVNGLGDVTDVRVEAREVPAEVAGRIAAAVRCAWAAAARSVALAAADDNPLARRPGLGEFIQEQIDERYGPPGQVLPHASPPHASQPPARVPPASGRRRPAAGGRGRQVDDDVDFSEQSVLVRGDRRR